MKRRLITICVCLLLGAIVNVAVAWVAGAFDQSHGFTNPIAMSSPAPGVRWTIEFEDGAVSTWVISYAVEAPLTGTVANSISAAPSWVPLKTLRAAGQSQRFQACGWPKRSLWSEWVWDTSDQCHTTDIWHWGLVLPMFDAITPDGTVRHALPLHPLWPGFAINTVFYAAVLWLLLIGPGRLRRFIRRRRGLCPACAYPIGVSDVCTECGKPVSRQRPVEDSR